ncbi:MAG: SRPBCC domain-containing protein [Chloroflexia bacterium]|jgi:uncharacterized protein YndB with AHSA1/START domain|nr:SRPBCC domain-containing protein [Chloroflexia bacterium]
MTTASTDRHPGVTITRTFDAPRELVFAVWTDPKHMARWFGPRDFTNPVCELDVRPGGAILIHMRGPDGGIYPMKGAFQEVVPPERLVFTAAAFASEDGAFLLEDTTTVTFTEFDGKTELTMHAVVTKATPEAGGALAGMEQGWNETLDKLADYLARA